MQRQRRGEPDLARRQRGMGRGGGVTLKGGGRLSGSLIGKKEKRMDSNGGGVLRPP